MRRLKQIAHWCDRPAAGCLKQAAVNASLDPEVTVLTPIRTPRVDTIPVSNWTLTNWSCRRIRPYLHSINTGSSPLVSHLSSPAIQHNRVPATILVQVVTLIRPPKLYGVDIKCLLVIACGTRVQQALIKLTEAR